MTYKKWSIDRRIPISVMGVFGIQLVMLISWATYLEARVGHLESQAAHNSRISEQLARIDERVEGVRQEISLIRDQMGGIVRR